MSETDPFIDDRPNADAPEVLAPLQPPSAPVAGASAADRAQAALDAIEADARSSRPTHPANVASHPQHLAALEEKLHLRREVLGEHNKTQIAFRDPGEAPPANAPPPERLEITVADLPRLAPGDWTRAQTDRVVATATALGVGPYETVGLFNLTASPPPPPARELDLDALWGETAAANIKTVNALLTKLRAHDEELHDRLVPYIQRSAPAAEHALAVARRLTGHPPRPAPPPRQTPAAEPPDRAASRWPFVWADEVRR